MVSSLSPPGQENESWSLFDRILAGETIRDLHLKRVRKDGRMIDVRVAAAPMYNPDGTVRGVVRAYEDITERRRAEDQLQRVAHYDQLTGLPNRLSLQKELGRLLIGWRPPRSRPRSRCSISTASRTSTTRSAIRPATSS